MALEVAIRLDAGDSLDMLRMVDLRLHDRMWTQISTESVAYDAHRFFSREFIARNGDGQPGAVAVLWRLSDDYDPIEGRDFGGVLRRSFAWRVLIT